MTVTTKGWVQTENGDWLRAEDIRRVEVSEEATGGLQQVTLTCLGRARDDVYLSRTSLGRAREVRNRIVTQLQCDHDVRALGDPSCPDCGAQDPG